MSRLSTLLKNIFHYPYLCVELQNTTFDGSCLVNLEGAIKEVGGLQLIIFIDIYIAWEMWKQIHFA